MKKMELEELEYELSVCQVASLKDVDTSGELFFIARTDQELSLVCETWAVPRQALRREDGWRGFRVKGTLDFSLVGVLARLTAVLAEKGIGLFALSTYDTDYILVKQENFQPALDLLAQNGYRVL